VIPKRDSSFIQNNCTLWTNQVHLITTWFLIDMSQDEL